MPIPDTIRGVVAVLAIALLAGLSFAAGSWVFGIAPTYTKIALVVVLAVLAILLVAGKV